MITKSNFNQASFLSLLTYILQVQVNMVFILDVDWEIKCERFHFYCACCMKKYNRYSAGSRYGLKNITSSYTHIQNKNKTYKMNSPTIQLWSRSQNKKKINKTKKKLHRGKTCTHFFSLSGSCSCSCSHSPSISFMSIFGWNNNNNHIN